MPESHHTMPHDDNGHVRILAMGPSAWNDWRMTCPSEVPDLRGIRLRGKDLRGANLEGADLRGADLAGTILLKVDLRRSRLDRANLEGAFLEGATLDESSLQDANLAGANLKSASLQRCRLEKANLVRAMLAGANLTRANLRKADLRDANLFKAVLDGANLDGAVMDRHDCGEKSDRQAMLDRNHPADLFPALAAGSPGLAEDQSPFAATVPDDDAIGHGIERLRDDMNRHFAAQRQEMDRLVQAIERLSRQVDDKG
ncbi:MAG: pentapeptide repeat-containing protein [Geminicoccaceae bacterium]|nr:pentapeptide repeat-containing protein [Geminicoccaceae bacterium]